MTKRPLALAFVTAGLLMSTAQAATIIYDNVSNQVSAQPISPQYSLGYDAQGVSNFGNLIQPLSGYALTDATVLLSNFAYKSAYDPSGSSTGYSTAVTLKIYDATRTNVLASDTENVSIPWRPEPNPTACPTGGADDPANENAPYQSGTSCQSGANVLAGFTFANIVLPSQVVYDVAFGTTATNSSDFPGGPYNSLNFGWTTTAPSVGSNPDPNNAYWNNAPDTNYLCSVNGFCDAGAGGTNAFAGAVQLSGEVALPEPGTVSMILIGLGGVGLGKFRKVRASRSADATKEDK